MPPRGNDQSATARPHRPNPGGARPSRRRFLASLAFFALGRRPGPGCAAEALSTWCVAFSPDSRTLAAGTATGAIYLWDVATGELRRELAGHRDAVFGVHFSPDGAWLASCGRDAPGVRIWDLAAGRVLHGIAAHPQWTWCARFSPDGKRLATCGDDATVRLWNPATGLPAAELRGHRGTVKRVAWTADARRLLSVGDDGLLHVWDPAAGAELHALPGHGGWIESVAAGPGALAVTAGGDQTLRRWDTEKGKLLATVRVPVPDLSTLAVSPDGKAAATGSGDGTLHTWNVVTGAQLERRTVKMTPLDLAYSPDSRRLASAQRGGAAALWDAGTLNLQQSLGR